MLLEAILVLLALLVYLYVKDKKPSNMPPGPSEIPFYGQHPEETPESLERNRKKYGNIVTVRTGARRVVYLHDCKMAKEVLARAELAARPAYVVAMMADPLKTGGVSMSNGLQWMHDRRFMIRNLRNFGMGKSYLEGAMNIEAQALVEDLKKYKGEAINYPMSIRTAPLNVIWQMMASKRYDLRSKEVTAVYKATQELFGNIDSVLMHAYYPFLTKIPLAIRKNFYEPEVMEKFSKSLWITVEETIKEHEKKFDPNNVSDLIDEYLLEWNAAKKKGEDHCFRTGALGQIIADGFDAGSDTIHYSLRWTIFLLARDPAMAEDLQRRLDEAVPRDKPVSLQDKPILGFIESFMTEMFRYSSFLTVTFERSTNKDTYIEGYFIPKDTVIKAVTISIHNDPTVYESPQEFRPHRFLDKDGKFVPPKEGFFTFSSGKRACPGENLAKAEVFLFTVALLQNFDIRVPEGVKFVDKLDLGAFGLRIPYDQKLVYHPRV